MGLSPQLEAQLQNARLGILVPVLLDLGVEYCEDLKFMKESDIGGRQDISLIQKRRFLEWRASVLKAGGDDSSSEAEEDEREPQPQPQPQPRPSQLLDVTQDAPIRSATNTGRSHRSISSSGSKAHIEASPAAGSVRNTHTSICSSASKTHIDAAPMSAASLSRTQSSIGPSASSSGQCQRQPQFAGPSNDMSVPLPMQTPRTRAMPFVDILREMENLDIALKSERERTSNLVEEREVLKENHARDMKMLEEMMQHAYAEIANLKSTVAAWEHTKGGDKWDDEDMKGERVTFAPRESPVEDEPEMEPRRACLPKLALPHLEMPSFGLGTPNF